MTNDERVTVRLNQDLAEKLRSEDNSSAVVRNVLDAYYSSGESEIAALETRLNRIKEERSRLGKRDEQLKEEQERLEAQLEVLKPDVEEIVKEATPIVKGRTDPSNPAVVNWAEKAGLTPQELLERVNGNGKNSGILSQSEGASS